MIQAELQLSAVGLAPATLGCRQMLVDVTRPSHRVAAVVAGSRSSLTRESPLVAVAIASVVLQRAE